MKASASPKFSLAALLPFAAVALLCMLDAPTPRADVDFDLMSMKPSLRSSTTYRLAANPVEFEGKTLRLAGAFVLAEDEDSAGVHRSFAIAPASEAGCVCCSVVDPVEFLPKAKYSWPGDFPSNESPIVVTGRLEMYDEAGRRFPRIADADFNLWKRE